MTLNDIVKNVFKNEIVQDTFDLLAMCVCYIFGAAALVVGAILATALAIGFVYQLFLHPVIVIGIMGVLFGLWVWINIRYG